MGVLYQLAGLESLGLIFVFHPIFAFLNGILTSRLFLMFHGTDWFILATTTALSMPFFVLAIFQMINFTSAYLIKYNFGSHIQCSTVFFVMLLINSFGISVGTLQGFLDGKIVTPTKLNRVARFLPTTQYDKGQWLIFWVRATVYGIQSGLIAYFSFNYIYS